MKNITIGLLLVLSFVILSCSKDKDPEAASCSNFEVSYDKVYELADNWKVVAFISGNSGEEECVPSVYSNLMDIHFPNDTSFIANSTCNRFQGNISFLSADEIRVSGVSTTLSTCLDMDFEYWEELYYDELKSAKYVRIDGNKLTIHTFLNSKIICKTVD